MCVIYLLMICYDYCVIEMYWCEWLLCIDVLFGVMLLFVDIEFDSDEVYVWQDVVVCLICVEMFNGDYFYLWY